MYTHTANGITKGTKCSVFSITHPTENNMYSHGTLNKMKGNGIGKENKQKILLSCAKTQNVKEQYAQNKILEVRTYRKI